MAGVRIRWRGVARVAAIVLVGVLAVRLLPGFLRAPEPPPLAANVGLPRAKPVTEVPRGGAAQPVTDVPGRRAAVPAATRPHKRRRRPRPQKSRQRPVKDAPAAEAVIGSRRKHRVKLHPRPEQVAEPAPPPASEYVPPAIPEPVPAPLPEPSPAPPTTPGDGSQEFAPH
jgi:hypothetical protein